MVRDSERPTDSLNPNYICDALDSLYRQAVEAKQEKLAEDILSLGGLFRALFFGPQNESTAHAGKATGHVKHSAVEKSLSYMEKHYTEHLTLPLLAEQVGLSPNYLSSLFRKTLSAGFAEKLNQIRIDRACGYFASGSARTYEVAYKVGFKDEKYFSSVFKKLKGVSPSEYRKNKRSAKI